MVYFLQLSYQTPVSILRSSAPSISSSLILSSEQYVLNTRNHEVPNSVIFSVLPPFPPFQTQISSSALPTLKRPKLMPFTHVKPSFTPIQNNRQNYSSVFTYTYSQNTTICQIVSLCNKQHYIIYNYMFRPCKRAIIRLFTEPSSRLHNRSLGGQDLVLHKSLYVCNMILYRIILTL